MKNLYFLFLFLLFTTIYTQEIPLEYGSSAESVEIVNLSCEDYLISDCLYLENGNQYYSYFKSINNDECNSFVFDGYEMSLLKNQLTSSILSIINSVSTNQFYSRNSNRKKNLEEEIFNSVSKSYSNAILFNPKFAFCDDNDSRKIIVYVERSKFDSDQKLFFQATIKRLIQQLRESERFKILNPNYQFKEELIKIESSLNVLRSFYSLMITLGVNEKTLDEYIALEGKSKTFKNSINSLNNNLIRVDEYISNKNFTSAYNLIKELKVKFNGIDQTKMINQKQKEYSDLVRLEKNTKKKEYKKNASSFNNLSLDANFNSALVNNSTNSSGERNYSNNSTFDRMYPALGFKYIINDRNRKWGLGPYYKLHLSQSLIVLKNIEYFFPFSKNFSEVGLWGQYFINSYSSSSITFSGAKLLGNYQDLNGDSLNFWTFSPGYKIKLNKTSFYAGFIITRADSEFSFNGLSLGLSYDIKLNSKISESQNKKLDEEYPIKF